MPQGYISNIFVSMRHKLVVHRKIKPRIKGNSDINTNHHRTIKLFYLHVDTCHYMSRQRNEETGDQDDTMCRWRRRKRLPSSLHRRRVLTWQWKDRICFFGKKLKLLSTIPYIGFFKWYYQRSKGGQITFEPWKHSVACRRHYLQSRNRARVDCCI